MKFSKLTKFLDVKKIFKSVKLIANVPKSGMTVNNNKTKKMELKQIRSTIRTIPIFGESVHIVHLIFHFDKIYNLGLNESE